MRHADIMHRVSFSLLFALALAGCEAPGVRSNAGQGEPPAALQAAAEHPPAKPDDIAWPEGIAWRDWEPALRAAKAENKAVCLVVYADWCPNCKELAPEFAKPEVARAAAKLLMVRLDQDEHPWLEQRLGAYGTYLPRVLFLDAGGQVLEELQSGHPRYPYFYAPLVTDRLIANMRAAARR